MNDPKCAPAYRLINRKEVEFLTGLSRSGIYARLDLNSPIFDPTFPKQITMGTMSVVWEFSAVQNWIQALISKTRAADAASANKAVASGSDRKTRIASKRHARVLIVGNHQAAAP
jgi:prophage regulatory protein